MPIFSRLAQQSSTSYSSLRRTKCLLPKVLIFFKNWNFCEAVMTRSPFRKGYLNLPTAYKRYAFEFSGQTFHKEMLHRRSWSNSVFGTLIYNTATRPPLECRCFLLFLNFRYPLACTLTLGGWTFSAGGTSQSRKSS